MAERILTPADHFGFEPGTERKLLSWSELLSYYRLLAETSDCVRILDLGRTTEDRDFVAVVASSPENMSRLDRLRALQHRLADPRVASEDELREAIDFGRAVVLVNCSMHPAEAGATQAAPRLVYDLVTSDDPDTALIRENTILLLVPSMNPDGLELVREWYERTLNTPAEGTWPPSITHKYCGGENSYDWATLTQVEARQLIERLFNDWYPHVFLDLHQMEPDGFRCILPPGTDPIDPIVDPVIRAEMASFGPAMAARMTAEGLTGVATGIYFGSSSVDHDYSRYHNCIYLLSEVASSNLASPVEISDGLKPLEGFDPTLPAGNHPVPWSGDRWHFSDVVRYDLAIIRACLLEAATRRKDLLRNFLGTQRRSCAGTGGYLIDATGAHGEAACEAVEVLRRAQVEVMRLREEVSVGGETFQSGSFYVPLAQPFSPFARAALDPAPYPPSGIDENSRRRAFDRAAAFHMPLLFGLRSAHAEHVDATAVEALDAAPKPAGAAMPETAQFYLCEPTSNGVIRAVNVLLVRSVRIERICEDAALGSAPAMAGTFLVSGASGADMREIARQTGTQWRSVDALPEGILRTEIVLPRIGIYKSYLTGFGVCDEGWLRFVLDEYGFPFISIFNEDIRAGDLRSRFDVVILPQQLPRDIVHGHDPRRFQGAAPEFEEPSAAGTTDEIPESPYPEKYRGGIGAEGMASLRLFVSEGGMLVGMDTAANVVIDCLGLPVSNVLRTVGRDDFNIPGALVALDVDPSHPLGYGYRNGAAGVFQHSPAFEVKGEAAIAARHAHQGNIVAGWGHGAERLAGLSALVDVPFGAGRAVLFGFRPHYRAQARSTYRFLFNALYSAGSKGNDRPAAITTDNRQTLSLSIEGVSQ